MRSASLFRILAAFLAAAVLSAVSARASEDLENWTAGKPAPALTVKRQIVGNCWAHAATTLIENFAARMGHPVTLSADALTVKYAADNLTGRDYTEAGRRRRDPPVTKTTEGNLAYAYGKFRGYDGLGFLPSGLDAWIRDNRLAKYSEWVTGVAGWYITGALEEAERQGLYPESHALLNPDRIARERRLAIAPLVSWSFEDRERDFREWAKRKLTDPNWTQAGDRNLRAETRNEYLRLFDLRPDLGSAPIEFENRQYATPVDFAKSLGYAYGRVRTRSFGRPTRADAEEFARVVRTQLDRGATVAFSYDIYDSTKGITSARGTEARKGVMRSSMIGDPEKSHVAGHIVVAVNTLHDAQGNVQAIVAQNSWGRRGRDRYGRENADPNELGYDVITLDYLVAQPNAYLDSAWIE